MAGLPLVLDELERPRAVHLAELGVGVGLRQALGHDERGWCRRRGERFEYRKAAPQDDAEGAVVDHFDRRGGSEEGLAVGVVALSPALDRGDRIGGAHRLPIVELEPVAQPKGIGQPVGASLPAIDHLGLRVKRAVHPKQRVVDQIAKIAGDVDAAEIGIDDRQIRVRHHPQCVAGITLRHSGQDRWGGKGDGDQQTHRGYEHTDLLELSAYQAPWFCQSGAGRSLA